ncbi:MAG TPA: hypothetical protein VKB31_06785 [Trueperaceae bacterium]|nr:hypothetical protein [Trueperaceae bacterium]
MAVLAWLGIVMASLLLVLLLLLALLLLLPVAVEAAWGEARRDVALAGPGVRVSFDVRTRTTELRLLSRRVGRWATAGDRPKPRRRRRRGPRPSPRKLWADRGRVLAALRAFFRRLHVRRLSLEATLATPDPALTGWLTGAAYAARAVTPPTVRRAITLQPDFASESPRIALDASLRLRPVHAALLAVRMWRVVRRARAGTAGRGFGAWRMPFASVRRGAGDGTGRRAGASAGREDTGTNRPHGGGRK